MINFDYEAKDQSDHFQPLEKSSKIEKLSRDLKMATWKQGYQR